MRILLGFLLCIVSVSTWVEAEVQTEKTKVVLSKIEKLAVRNTENKDVATTATQEQLSTTRKKEIIDLLHQDCGACHGINLLGGLGPSLLPKALEKLTEDQVVQTITNGRAGTPMPPWKPFFNEQEVRWLAHQLKQGIEEDNNENL